MRCCGNDVSRRTCWPLLCSQHPRFRAHILSPSLTIPNWRHCSEGLAATPVWMVVTPASLPSASHSRFVRCTPVHSRLVRCTPVHSRLVHCTPVHSRFVRCTPVHSRLVRCTPVHSRLVRCISTYSRLVTLALSVTPASSVTPVSGGHSHLWWPLP